MTPTVLVVRPGSSGCDGLTLHVFPIDREPVFSWYVAAWLNRGWRAGRPRHRIGFFFPDRPPWGYGVSPMVLAGRPVVYIHGYTSEKPNFVVYTYPGLRLPPDRDPR